jgi:hypothetical protein
MFIPSIALVYRTDNSVAYLFTTQKLQLHQIFAQESGNPL